ncbi:MAG: hypothetical protein U0744_03065 [Gemmataceae bacterium]
MSAIVGLLVGIALIVVRPVLSVIGSVLCWRSPSSTNGRPWLLASAILEIAQLVGGIAVGSVIALSEPNTSPVAVGAIGNDIVSTLLYFMAFGSWFCLMTFIRKIADFLKAYGESAEAGTLVILGSAVLLIVPPAVLLIRYLIVHQRRALGQALGPIIYLSALAWTVAAAVVFIRVLQMIANVRKSLKEEIERTGG